MIYVDDILIASSSDDLVEEFKSLLNSHFKLKDLGNLKYFIGLEIARSKAGISICQRKYTLDLLEEYGFLGAKPGRIPIEVNHGLTHRKDGLLQDPTHYRQLVGNLLFLTVTRPDICYSVHVLTQFMDKLSLVHLEAAYKVLKYLKAAPGQGLFMSAKSTLQLKAFTDSDWEVVKKQESL